MKIINIKKKGTNFVIEFDNNQTLTVVDVIKIDFNLYKNKVITEKTLSELKEQNEIEKLFSKSVKRLLIHDYSPSKMREYLKKNGGTKSQIDEVIKKLRKYSFLNEEEIIKNVISYCDSKHYGFNKIILMLIQREIDKTKIDKVKYNLKREQKEAKLQADILKNRYKNKNNHNLKNSVYSSLIRYGFNDEVAKNITSKIHNSPTDELNVLKLEYQKLFSSYSRKIKGKELRQKITDKLLSKGYKYSDIKLLLEEN